MITIDRMNVTFDVEGDDEEVFARLFRAHMERWQREEQERGRARVRLERDRSIHAAPPPIGRGR